MSEIRVTARSSSSDSPLLGCRLPTSCVLTWQRAKQSKLGTFIRALTPLVRALSSWPYLILFTSYRPHLLMLSHWGAGLRHTNLEGRGNTNIQSIAVCFTCSRLSKFCWTHHNSSQLLNRCYKPTTLHHVCINMPNTAKRKLLPSPLDKGERGSER